MHSTQQRFRFVCQSSGGQSLARRKVASRHMSYDEEIKVLKQWLADRLSFLDRQIARFDKDWQPRIQELKEIKAPQFGGFGGFGGFAGFGGF